MTRLFEDDIYGFDRQVPDSELLTSPGPGIGIAPEQAPAPVETAPRVKTNLGEREDMLAGMSGAEKFFGALGDIGRGLQGKPLLIDSMGEQRRKEKKMKLEELQGSVSALEHGAKMIEGLQGPQRQQFIDAYATRLDGIDPGLGDTYRRLADRPALLTGFEKYVPYLPAPMQELAKRDPKAFLKLAGTEAGMKEINKAADQPLLQLAGRRRDTVIMGWQQLVPKDVADRFNKDGVLTESEINEMQQHLPEKLRFTDEEREAIKRSGGIFWEGSGVLHGKKADEVLADRAKQANKPDKAQSELGKLKADLDAGLITPELYKAKVQKLTHVAPTGGKDQQKVIDVELKVSDDYRQDTRKFAERRPLFDSATDYMANRTKEKTSAGDAALLFAYAKMRDPNDRLAVSETRDLVKLGNIFERFGVSVQAILDKGETLPDRVAADMYKEIRRAFTEQNKQQLRLEADTERKVKDYGGNPERVVRRFAIPEKDLRPKDKPGGGVEVNGRIKQRVGDIVDRGGKKWKIVGHDKDGEPLVEEVR